MNIVNALSLSREQIKEIHDITNLCRKQDGISLSCPNDGDDFWLLYEGDPKTSSIRAFLQYLKQTLPAGNVMPLPGPTPAVGDIFPHC